MNTGFPPSRGWFVGAGATCDFDDKGDQINRSFLHQVIEGGKNKIVGVVT